MKVERQFTVAAPMHSAWQQLIEVPGLVACIPGAELHAVPGEQSFAGEVRLGVNGSSVRCQAIVRPIDADEDGKSATLRVQGRELGGARRGSGIIHGQLAAADGGTRVALDADLTLAGQGLPDSVVQQGAQQLLDGFADELQKRIATAAKAAPTASAIPSAAPAASSVASAVPAAVTPPASPAPTAPSTPAVPQQGGGMSLSLPGALANVPPKAGIAGGVALLVLAVLRSTLGRRSKRVQVALKLRW